jgi:hypothetical protein
VAFLAAGAAVFRGVPGCRKCGLSGSPGSRDVCFSVVTAADSVTRADPATLDSQPPWGRARANSAAAWLQCVQMVCWGASAAVSAVSACLGVPVWAGLGVEVSLRHI